MTSVDVAGPLSNLYLKSLVDSISSVRHWLLAQLNGGTTLLLTVCELLYGPWNLIQSGRFVVRVKGVSICELSGFTDVDLDWVSTHICLIYGLVERTAQSRLSVVELLDGAEPDEPRLVQNGEAAAWLSQISGLQNQRQGSVLLLPFESELHQLLRNLGGTLDNARVPFGVGITKAGVLLVARLRLVNTITSAVCHQGTEQVLYPVSVRSKRMSKMCESIL